MKFIFLFIFFLGSCGLTTVRPKLEMSLAQAAYQAAKAANAQEKSPDLFRKSEILFLQAKSAYKRKFFNKAKEYAQASQKMAELAEFNAKRTSLQGE